MTRKLTLDDIADLRAYEREREQFRAHVIDLKKRRRVPVGPLVSVVFENRDTVRFQVQEMARAERMRTDEAIMAELAAYNPLIPDPGQLCATMFLELTTRQELEQWLPKLVGIERHVQLVVGDGPSAVVVPATLDEAHAAQLTRDEVTASVHYLRFEVAEPVVDRFAAEPVVLAVDHPAYAHRTTLPAETKESLLQDLRP